MIRRIAKEVFYALSSSQGLITRLYMDYSKVDKSPKSKRDLLITMNRGISVLEKLGISYSLAKGTLLGLHRDGEFTDGENDIDIDIFGDKDIHNIISSMPFDILLINIFKGKYQQLVFIDPETKVLFDIYFFHFNINCYENKHMQGYFKMPMGREKDFSTIQVKGRKYTAFDPEWYCEYWFGENWKSPKTYSATWVDHYKNDCSGFKFKPEKNVKYINLYQNSTSN
jgi:hypothetical protein